MRNTWWFTRPKRDLVAVPHLLRVLANIAEGKVWATADKERELEYERQLEASRLKAQGIRRDQRGGGARTYRSWLKSLGLLYMDEDGRLWLTSAGEALVEGAPPLEIIKNQVLKYQFPAAFSVQGQSKVSRRFQVRPFVLLLQLLRDSRLGGYLDENEDIAKVVICHGTGNSDADSEALIERILTLRKHGDSSLETDYVQRYATKRQGQITFGELVKNHIDIANTAGNWLGYTQLVTRHGGEWRLSAQEDAQQEVDRVLEQLQSAPLIGDPEDEPKFQRRYGLKPGQKKDTRRQLGTSISRRGMVDNLVASAFYGLSGERPVTHLTPDIVQEVAGRVAVKYDDAERILRRIAPSGDVEYFLHEYSQMAFDSGKRAREFERATAAIFRDIFGLDAEHVGDKGRVPDVMVSSDEGGWSGIIDTKAYSNGYRLGISQQDRMVDYAQRFETYAMGRPPLRFFAYIVSDHKPTISRQIQDISRRVGTPGVAITARHIIEMVKRHRREPYTQEELVALFSKNRALDARDLGHPEAAKQPLQV